MLKGETDNDSTLIRLGKDLWFDRGRCSIFRNDICIPLTARETTLLTKLLESPNYFLSVRILALCLTKPGDSLFDEHCLEQVVYNLRRKLGEEVRRPRLVLNRRDIGYGIFLQEVAEPFLSSQAASPY